MTDSFFDAQPEPEAIARRLGDLGAWFEVDLDCIGRNLEAIRERTGVEVMPVVKNDCYGHGLVPVSAYLAQRGVRWVMVARTAEALALRARLPALEVVNMDTPFSDAQVAAVVEAGATQVVYTASLAERVERAAAAAGRLAQVFLKVDTGLRRVGVWHEEALALAERIDRLPNVRLAGTFSTFMQNTTQDNDILDRFQALLAAFAAKGIDPGFRSLASSNAIIHRPESWLDMVRPAMALLGIYPEPADRGHGLELHQALAFKARIEHAKWVESGDTVTYFGRFVAPARMRIGTLHVGFYDAIPREMANQGRIRVGDRYQPSVGSVSLNHFLFDLTGVDARVGDTVEVIGRDGENDLGSTASAAGWMVYSLLNHLNPFTPRVYYSAGQPCAILERSPAG